MAPSGDKNSAGSVAECHPAAPTLCKRRKEWATHGVGNIKDEAPNNSAIPELTMERACKGIRHTRNLIRHKL